MAVLARLLWVLRRMTRLLSIDPGGKGGDTGIVLLEYNVKTLPKMVESWAVGDGLDGFRKWLEVYWLVAFADVHIVETFVHFKNIQIETTPILIEGAVRFKWPDTILSPASGKNTAVPDDVLKRLGLYIAGDHHRDRLEAVRHAIRYLKNQRHIPTLKAGWPQD